MTKETNQDQAAPSNFLRQAIEADLQTGKHQNRYWAGEPADAKTHKQGTLDTAKIRTRFPPEPNGYLHIGHAKSIWLNFQLAKEYGGVCHLRFDDTNPEKEEQEYVNGIREAVHWLGYDHHFADDPARPNIRQPHEYFASDYFDFMYKAAVYLIEQGLAYVDEQTPEEMKQNRGDFTHAGKNSPYRDRSPEENLAKFTEMKEGKHDDGKMVLRAKIDMASPNINMRDPALYRIRRAMHHNTGNTWCIYPMYTFAHPIEDALENITHSICTLEFEDQRPFYDWLMEKLSQGGLINSPPPRQYEFARLNVGHVITSKRKLRQLVEENHVNSWDDPRMPTLAGLRRRGYTPESIKLFAERSGVTKSSNAWTNYAALDAALRESLEETAPRGMCVLDPIKLKITNWEEIFADKNHIEKCTAPMHPHHSEMGERHFNFSPELWIEKSDYEQTPPKGFHRLYPGNKVRLKYAYIIECTGEETDQNGNKVVLAKIIPNTKSGTEGASSVKVKGTITWLSTTDSVKAKINLYDRLFTEEQPDAGGRDFLTVLNPNSLQIKEGYIEPKLAKAQKEDRYQFERHGYFVADLKESSQGAPVFNRITELKDSWK